MAIRGPRISKSSRHTRAEAGGAKPFAVVEAVRPSSVG
jgi:hypothetical protein